MTRELIEELRAATAVFRYDGDEYRVPKAGLMARAASELSRLQAAHDQALAELRHEREWRGKERAELQAAQAEVERLQRPSIDDELPAPKAGPALKAMVRSTPREGEDWTAAARAYYEATHPANTSPMGSFARWATWEEASEAAGVADEIVRGLKAAFAALRRPLQDGKAP